MNSDMGELPYSSALIFTPSRSHRTVPELLSLAVIPALGVLIGAGGLVGPAIVGGLFYVLALRPLSARIALGLVSLLLLVVEFTVASGGFSLFFVGTLCVICAVLALSRSILPQAAMIFLAIQLSLSLFWDWSYLFSEHGGVSDVARMSEALGMPYWFWGASCATISIVSLTTGAFLFFRGRRRVQ